MTQMAETVLNASHSIVMFLGLVAVAGFWAVVFLAVAVHVLGLIGIGNGTPWTSTGDEE